MVSIPSGRGFWAGIIRTMKQARRAWSQSPLVGASGPAESFKNQFDWLSNVSIPSGRGFWAGGTSPHALQDWAWKVSIPSGRGFWAGRCLPTTIGGRWLVSIPSGRGFWAGPVPAPHLTSLS